ncbi:CPBP family intramembrane metalloprotease [Gordonibacter urolithinfaciens]|uniref:Tat pathway signal sequence n=1 Tax=Gordonibacter urolithinfaciens TaxID=1335613 RepID=A0A6N8IIM7_9ACTN|nr:Tat pathway signal sequence [Gordonibacter urolithinfaciens]MVN15685.1 Tat pathway signal sequence [Gordonibacter urolithinfaciens]MVN39224.1 Tat pathway signal sequence [Gordonibacter urolithinfaciens]MVN56172.1 Tat pathway signal sequence [Gordonibacter urolithinfaciens]MVN61495.1 Tat pathway signal sequence [Gordonibacter urolithinfaciens]
MKQTSGIDALLEALRQSGVNVDGRFDADAEAPSDGAARAGRGGGGGSQPPHVHVEVPFADRMAAWGKKALIIAAIVIVLVGLAAYWWFHPPINIHSTDTWMFVAVFILLPLFLVFWSRSHSYKEGTARVEANPGKAKAFKFASYVPVAVAVLGVLGAVMSLSIFPGNAEKYATVLQTTEDNFAQDIKEVNYSEIPVIDRDSAVLLGNREMGSIPEYVSQFEISPLYSQINYQSSPVRVSPLGYADLFKWFTNREAGIPAYALVNMTTQDAEIVRLEDNPIHYSESEPLVRNIDRHVQLSYPFYMFDQKSFEIDDEGHPWWICPVQSRTIGLFGGTTIERVVMVDATTGETQDLAIEDVPQWVDHAYPTDLLLEQYNWSGKYKDGWLNSVFGQKNVVQTTPGTDGNPGYNYIAKDDDVWVYTGVTSATADNSIVGFVLINQRTAESHFYPVAGATEESAMQSAEGQVQNLRYQATFPLLINVSGQPTYFMALKDNAGLVKQFAMLDIQRYQNVAVGNTVAECQKAYQALLATNGVLAESGVDTGAVEKQGTIAHIAQAVVEGNSHFYVKLDDGSAIYDFALPGLIEIVGYKEGDAITFTYVEAEPTNPVEEIVGADGTKTGNGADAAKEAEKEADATADAKGDAA